MIKHFSNHIIVNYIKQLMHSFNLPTCKVINDNDTVYVFKNKSYLYNNKIYIAKKTQQIDNFSKSNLVDFDL